jgi:hypothetical protein
MNSELEKMEGSDRGQILKYYSVIRLVELRKATKVISHYSWFPARDLNPERPQYEMGVYTTRPRRSVHGVAH